MHRKYVGVGVGISVGLGLGAALGAALQNVAVGAAMGAGLGVALSLIFAEDSDAALARKKAAADKPLPHPLGL